MLTKQGRAARTRLLFSAPYRPGTEGNGSGYDDAIASMRDEGLDVNGLTLPRSGGFLSGLATDMLFPTPRGRRSANSTSAVVWRRFVTRTRVANSSRGEGRAPARTGARAYFWLGNEDRPTYTRDATESLHSMAKARGVHPVELWIDKMLQTNGEAMFHVRFFNNDLGRLRSFLSLDWMLPGIGDAGAHVSQIMDSGWTSFLLSHWVRDEGLFTIEEAVRRMTSASARVLGFNDRGTLAEGMKADINVIDLDRVAERQPKLVHDFPGGAPRLIQKAVGYKATVCNGAVILTDDTHTGERSGQVLRNPSSA